VLICYLCQALHAATPVSVDDLVGRVVRAFAVDRNDERMADEIGSLHLSERLSAVTVDQLRQMGAGPATVRALEKLARKSEKLPPPSEEPISVSPSPGAAERAAMIDSMRRYAAGYLATLPDFVCKRESRQWHTRVIPRLSPSRGGLSTIPEADTHWRLTGSYTAEASFVTAGIAIV